MEPPLDRGYGEREKPVDPQHGPLFEVAKDDDAPELARQLFDRTPELGVALVTQPLRLGIACQLRAVLQEDPIELRRIGRRDRRRSPGHSRRPVPGDGVEPRTEPLRLGKLRQRFERGEEHILRHILGCLPRAHHRSGNGDQRAPIASHQLIERFQVSEQRPDYQLALFGYRARGRRLALLSSLPPPMRPLPRRRIAVFRF